MSIHAAFGVTIVVGSAILGVHPFDKKRVFARWAKAVFGITAISGIILGCIELGWGLRWFELGDEAGSRLAGVLSFGRGMMLGLILSLFLSGQLIGSKRTIPEDKKEPIQPPQTTTGSSAPDRV